MKPSDNVGVVFVNTVVGRGVLNSVINVQLGVLNFDITDEGKVSSDISVACRLRMDMACAKQLRDVLDDLLVQIEKAEAVAHAGLTNGDGRHSDEVLN
jgi:hypothetical protein